MTTPELTRLSNDLEIIHSTEVIDRLAELERRLAAADLEDADPDPEDVEEREALVDLERQCLARGRAAWHNGIELRHWFAVTHLPEWWDEVTFDGMTYMLRVG
jgi:hypothetical protein